jgi:hypothetical protein
VLNEIAALVLVSETDDCRERMFANTISAVRYTDYNAIDRYPSDESLGYYQSSAKCGLAPFPVFLGEMGVP